MEPQAGFIPAVTMRATFQAQPRRGVWEEGVPRGRTAVLTREKEVTPTDRLSGTGTCLAACSCSLERFPRGQRKLYGPPDRDARSESQFAANPLQVAIAKLP